ncbi:MAG: pyridine nucleotide-disulfide oxidoreductase, partial [Corynebacterium variabile]
VPGSADPEAELRETLPGVYATGWVRRGPVGLIGNTKGDANQAVANLLEDAEKGLGFTPEDASEEGIIELLHSRGINYSTWEGWYNLDAHERALGEAEGRERKKVREIEEMVRYSSGEARVEA